MIKKFRSTLTLVIGNFFIFFLTSQDIYVRQQIFDFCGYNSAKVNFIDLFTYMFLHLNNSHLISNMVTLLLFGIPLENEVGNNDFLKIYFFSGVFGILLYSLFLIIPSCVGASIAIFGTMGAYIGTPRANFLLKMLICIMLILEVESMNNNDNATHGGHLLGFLLGFLYYQFVIKNTSKPYLLQ